MFKKVSLIIILVLALASGFYFFKENSKPNYISSKPMPKPAPFLKHTSKLQSPFTIKFENNNSDVQEGDQFTLTAIISSNMNIDELELKWMAGDGLEHIVGKLEETRSLLRGEPLRLSVTYKQLNAINQKVHLIIASKDENKSFSKSQQYNSLDEEQINDYNNKLTIKNQESLKK